MVSELSTRLMQGNNYTASTKADCTRSSVVVSPTPLSDHEPMMTISACTEKLDLISTRTKTLARKNPAPVSVSSSVGCFKRRKVDELQFAASRVKEDLAKGGLSYPALDTSLRHHLDLENIEDATRGVSRVCAKSVSESPFLYKSTVNCSAMASMSDYGSLFSATFDSYGSSSTKSSSSNSGGATYVSNSDVGSICSLSSERSSDASFIAPRLEDALNNKKVKMEETRELKEQMAATAPQRRAIYSNPITIRDAFENSDEARIVTLSFAPFLVVHVNPAYTRSTGLSPANILGKPFHEVIEDPSCKANTAKASSLTSLHERVTSFVHSGSKGDSESTFSVNVAVVGPEPSDHPSSHLDHKSFTHYMISLAEYQEPVPEVVTTAAAVTFTAPAPVSPIVANLMVLPTIQILEANLALMPTMRLHCGVMG